ncbi:MAG: hypothetical protein LBN36_04575 [Clostridiales Family XIII bacterium]|jgi:hypothetical protein|nr:hypothetical protein [Clostridiales Family XIII bacterium]
MNGISINAQKPKCPIIGANGSTYNLVGIVSKTLTENGMPDKAKEMRDRVFGSGNYTEALGIIMEYVDPVSENEMSEGEELQMA